jgi:CRISPR-associated protein Cas6
MPVPESPVSVVDLAFNIEGTSLPTDHDWPLLRAVEGRLPWFAGEPLAGIHSLRTVQTSHGIALLAQRAKLVLRLPEARLPDALLLQDAGFDIGGSALHIGAGTARKLRPSATLSAHRVATDASDDAAFEADIERLLQRMGIDCGFISGRRRQGNAGEREIEGFALTLHGLGAVDSLRIQGEGLGGHRRLGWGIFVPAKSIAGAWE